ncbi:MAG: ATP synthase subunit I [Anaerolineae bacterium]|nr:ATP synthase subunit I [Anaerolineae bacterium]
MTEGFPLGMALLAGVGLGLFYFGGLWLTVQQLLTIRRPVALLLVSYMGRIGVTLLGFYVVAGGHWERLLVCLLGFLIIRGIWLWS